MGRVPHIHLLAILAAGALMALATIGIVRAILRRASVSTRPV